MAGGPPAASLRLDDAARLDARAVLAIGRGELAPSLSDDLARRLDERRARMLAALDGAGPVYGVTTGMGALSTHELPEPARAGQSEALMTARSAGGPPWLSPAETRAVLATRLRSFLNGDAAVSARLCGRLAESIALGVLPALPRRPMGVAGEIVGLAHLGAALLGTGDVLAMGTAAAPEASTVLAGESALAGKSALAGESVPAGKSVPAGETVPASQALSQAGLAPLRLGPKEGVALIQGVPMTTALAVLAAADARKVLGHSVTIVAAEFAIAGAARDVLDARLARGDAVLAGVTGRLRGLAGPAARPRALQPPVSFRAAPQVLAHLDRMIGAVDAAAGRALDGVSDSPAFLDGQFVGSAGFYGYDLAVHLHALTVALIGVAELGVARLHRLLDPAVSGLNAQLSARPGPQAGLSPVHKRAVGVAHELRRQGLPSVIGPVETSAGQEDAQSFSLEAAQSCRIALDGATEVLACELLAIHQARCLGAPGGAASIAAVPPGTPPLRAELDALTAGLPGSAQDRPWGRDIERLRERLSG
jgi:histidine ammonia-lyase